MKGNLLVVLAIVAVACWAGAAGATSTYDLSQINGTAPSGSAPWATLNITENADGTLATLTLTVDNPGTLIFGNNAVDFQFSSAVTAPTAPALANPSATPPVIGVPVTPTAILGSSGDDINSGQQVDSWGRFNFNYDRFDGPTDGSGTWTFEVVTASGTLESGVLDTNSQGRHVAAHIWFPGTSAGTDGVPGVNTFYITDGPPVPVPPSALLLGSGLLGLVCLRRWRKKSQ